MSKTFTYYPGCSSQASAIHLDKSLRAVGSKLGYTFNDIADWNCCGASVGHIEGGHLPHHALSGRNLAQARQQGEDDVATPCAACYLNTHYTNETIRNNPKMKDKVNQALAAGGLSYDGSLHVRHICEIIVNDFGMDAVKAQVVKPLTGLKVAGWVGCQTVRPFARTDRGGNFDTSYDHPVFLDNMITACGAEPLDFKNRTACCGGSVSVMNPDKTLHLMKRILDEAQEKGADVITTPCPLCQTNLEMYQDEINKRHGTSFKFPVVFYSQLMTVAFGMDPKKDANLDAQMIPADKLAAFAG